MPNEQRTVEVFDLSRNSYSSSDCAGLKERLRPLPLSEPERSALQKMLGKKIESEHALQVFVTENPKALSEKRIDAMVEDLLKDEEYADVDLEIERDNAELRATYLRTTKLYTAKDIREQVAKKPKNPSEPSSRWKREGRVFAIQHDGKDMFPAFQFADGKPLPIIKKILEALPDYLSPWQTAFWFESGNGWLGGKTPQECLRNESKVIDAAEQLSKPTIG